MNPEHIFDGPALPPAAILNSRSDRAERQRALLKAGHPCLISFTLNIPGDIKQFSLARAGFHAGLEALRSSFAGHIRHEALTDAPTGCEALLSLDLPPEAVKAATARIEASHPLGRLFDMDVLRGDGTVLSRADLGLSPRPCLVCSQNAKLCARSRAHSLEELRRRVAHMLQTYFKDAPPAP